MKDTIEGTEVDVRRLRLKPGDEIVVTVEGNVSLERLHEMKDALNERWPDHRVTLLYGVELTVFES